MARWRVTAKHYINARQFGEKTEWVREETNRDTGRAFRRTFSVPLYIDPDDPICINKNVGFCVVATEGTEMPGDIILDGPPTPDMEPMDDEARAITAKESPKWKNPIDSLPIVVGQDFGQQLLAMLTAQFNAVDVSPTNASLKGVGSSELAELREMIAEQARQIAVLTGAKASVPEEPLPEIDPEASTPPPTTTVPRTARRV